VRLASRIATVASVAVLAAMGSLGIANAVGYTDNNVGNELITVTTTSTGYTPLLGVGQTYGNFHNTWNGVSGSIVVETESPTGGQSSLPFQHAVFYSNGGCQWQVRFLDQTGAAYASHSVTFRAIAAFDGNQPAPIC